MKDSETISGSSVASETEAIQQIVHSGLRYGYALAVWKLPGDDQKNVLLSYSAKQYKPESQLEDLESGFLFCPFNRNEDGYYMKADLLFTYRRGKLRTPETLIESRSVEWLRGQEDKTTPVSFYKPVAGQEVLNNHQPDFKELVQECIRLINQGTVEKLVPSRFKFIEVPQGFDPIAAFQKLCQAYPNAFVSLVSMPDAGTWLGASPEILVQVEDQAIFRTVALAGTQPYQAGTNLKEVAWTQKEIEEQALVSRYIINCFKKIRLREFEEHGPKTVIAGNLLHLKTDFEVDLKATNFPQLGSVMLTLLHPTSAVCGMPLEPALQFLQQREGYHRAYYSGYLGPINIDQAIHVFVNLRCLQVANQYLVCYAGCGVTADSIPDKEWEETEMKLNTLISVVR
ncbi:chorismate-binding protein [Oscillatoria amoena NRMC-F 0135]|nr:chorismate-binding protein [Oscillatoria amoena NRMC-F 0135]